MTNMAFAFQKCLLGMLVEADERGRVARTPPVVVCYLRDRRWFVFRTLKSDAFLKRDNPRSMSCLGVALVCARSALDHKVIIIIIIMYLQYVSVRRTSALASSPVGIPPLRGVHTHTHNIKM